jgi:hypothetical protein
MVGCALTAPILHAFKEINILSLNAYNQLYFPVLLVVLKEIPKVFIKTPRYRGEPIPSIIWLE